MPPKRMTANPVKPSRHRPHKPIAQEAQSSEEEDEDDEEDEGEGPAKSAPPPKPAPPKASSFNTTTINLAEQKRAAAAESERLRAAEAASRVNEDEFETEESDEASEDEAGSEEESEEESSSEDEAARRKMMRPVFKKKGERIASTGGGAANGSVGLAGTPTAIEDDEDQMKKKDAIIQAQLEQRAAEAASGRVQWDDDDIAAGLDDLDVDDTDDLDPAAEYAAWKLRELQRIKDARKKVEEEEKRREEEERRRNLTDAERQAEDREKEERIKEEAQRKREGRIAKNEEKGSYMQKYYHKGAFFQDTAEELGLKSRDPMLAKFEDERKGKDALPEYLQIRDETKLGRKGRTKHRDMRSEDTGQWGGYAKEARRPKDRESEVWAGGDSRFRPDYGRDRREERTGANAGPLGDRKRTVERDGPQRREKRPRID